MLKIRLTRIGRKHDPTYRLVVTDSRRAPQSGAYLENLGFYNPRKVGPGGKPLMADFQAKADRIKYWISQGAQLSGTAHNLLVDSKVIEGKKVNVFKRYKKKKKTEGVVEEKEVEEVKEAKEEVKEKVKEEGVDKT
jgi:small subunit ribosomal protein S16